MFNETELRLKFLQVGGRGEERGRGGEERRERERERGGERERERRGERQEWNNYLIIILYSIPHCQFA